MRDGRFSVLVCLPGTTASTAQRWGGRGKGGGGEGECLLVHLLACSLASPLTSPLPPSLQCP